MSRITLFLKNDSGSTPIEYGFIVISISVGIIAGFNLVNLPRMWSISTQLDKDGFLVVE